MRELAVGLAIIAAAVTIHASRAPVETGAEAAAASDSTAAVADPAPRGDTTPIASSNPEAGSAHAAGTELADGALPDRVAVADAVAAPVPAATYAGSSRPPVLRTQFGDLQILPADNPWNQDISRLSVHPLSMAYLRSMGLNTGLHPDFGTVWEGAPIGIPYVVVGSSQRKVPIEFEYRDESDPGPYPVPLNAPIEGGPHNSGDRHVVVIDYFNKKLYELFSAYPTGKGWKAGSGAVFDLTSNALRPDGWTSADAAGLPVFPGIVRYDEVVEQAEIRHALRFTVERTQRAYIRPATHFASPSHDPSLPPLGLRLRLRSDFDISGFPPNVQVILRALKKYGMFLADNGADWFISGSPDARWNDDELSTLKRVKGRDFEAVDTGEIITRP